MHKLTTHNEKLTKGFSIPCKGVLYEDREQRLTAVPVEFHLSNQLFPVRISHKVSYST